MPLERTKHMRLDEKWIREHLPERCRNESLDLFSADYLDGLTVMQEGERGGPDVVVYEAKDEEDLRYWQLKQVCRFIDDPEPPVRRRWRYERAFAKDGQWFYTEHRYYDYNAIEDDRLFGFESYLRLLKYSFPPDLWEEEVQTHVYLMNYWYTVPHWDYDREKLCFIEISDSKEYDDRSDKTEEPRPGSVIKITD